MGFSSLVNRGNVKDLESYFEKVTEVLAAIKVDKVELTSFLISDAIILIAPTGLKGLKDIISATRRIQSSLLWQKILLRGAISHGEVFYSKGNNIIVGKGFIKAYLLEQEAIYPRVILDPALIKIVGEDREEFVRLVQGDANESYDERLIYKRSQFSQINDDCIFIDYANKSILQHSLNGNIKKVYETIALNLYGDQKLYSKYVWLRDYFTEWLRLTRSNLEAEFSAAILFKRREPKHLNPQYNQVKNWQHKFERL